MACNYYLQIVKKNSALVLVLLLSSPALVLAQPGGKYESDIEPVQVDPVGPQESQRGGVGSVSEVPRGGARGGTKGNRPGPEDSTGLGSKRDGQEAEEKVKLGTIAASTSTRRNTAVSVETDGAAPGDEVSSISGSVSRTSKTTCVAKIINNGKKKYSVSFEVIGMDQRGNKGLSRSFSASVKPGETIERSVSGCRPDLNLEVNLKSARAS